jgi:hypothetical protein
MLAENSVFNPVPPSAYDLLETEILTGSQASVTFSSLGDYATAGYQHLQIRMTGRSTRSATNSDFDFRFNGDSGTNYTWHYMRGSGSAMESAGGGGLDSVRGYQTLTGATNTSGSFAATVIDILDPFETTKNTTIRFFTGFTGSLNRVLLESGAWLNTNAVTSITFDEYYGSSFSAGSRFSLYGLKAA